jgi:hypothetical protein
MKKLLTVLISRKLHSAFDETTNVGHLVSPLETFFVVKGPLH